LISRHFKKITDLKRASFSSIEGVLISDMTGEIGFINLQNLTKLPVLPATEEVGGEEETKEVNKDS